MDRKSSSEEILPKINNIFKGKVIAIKEFGAFVKIPWCTKNGLVHKSQISKSQIDAVSDVVNVGDSVWCKVVSISNDEKIGLSMKVVNQDDGKDLDPNGVTLSLDDRKRKAFGSASQPKIQLEAVYNTVCKKCGTKGHLAQDCFHTPGAKAYELLNDDSLTVEVQSSEKKTQNKKRNYDCGSSSSDSSSNEKHKRKKTKHKSKKSKKKKSQKRKKRSAHH